MKVNRDGAIVRDGSLKTPACVRCSARLEVPHRKPQFIIGEGIDIHKTCAQSRAARIKRDSGAEVPVRLANRT